MTRNPFHAKYVTKTYTATVGPDNAAWIARKDGESLLGGTIFTITDNGDGTITMDGETAAYLETLPETSDGHISRDSQGLVLWIEGIGYELTLR